MLHGVDYYAAWSAALTASSVRAFRALRFAEVRIILVRDMRLAARQKILSIAFEMSPSLKFIKL